MIRPKSRKKTQGPNSPSDYFPDIDEWPKHWMGAKEDLEIGRGLLALFIPFIQRLIDERLAKKTIKTHGWNLNILGREIIERLNQDDKDKRDASPRELILHFIDDEGGPLLSFWDPSDITDYRRHVAYDSTCRKLLKFMTSENN